jgi:hypothetical protein
MIDLVFPLMILLPVCTAILGVVCFARKRPNRAFLLGGVGLVFVFLIEAWFNLFSIHFLDRAILVSYLARLVSMPACLVVGTLGMLLGCLPDWSERPERVESAMIFCYLAGAAVLALGFFWDGLGYAAPLLAMLGVVGPVSFIAWRWWGGAFGHRSPVRTGAEVVNALRME